MAMDVAADDGELGVVGRQQIGGESGHGLPSVGGETSRPPSIAVPANRSYDRVPGPIERLIGELIVEFRGLNVLLLDLILHDLLDQETVQSGEGRAHRRAWADPRGIGPVGLDRRSDAGRGGQRRLGPKTGRALVAFLQPS
jgi:hypothetical protein